MCAVSMIADDWNRTTLPNYISNIPTNPLDQVVITLPSDITRFEFDELKKEVENLKRLLINAKEIDEVTGQKDCEKEEKVAMIKKIAELVGVDLSEIF